MPTYKHSEEVPIEAIIKRLEELSDAVTKGRDSVNREFYMSVPVNFEQDADFVLSEAAIRLKKTLTPSPPSCSGCRDGEFGPTHKGSIRCESGSIASGGLRAHCTCDVCF